MTASNPSPEPEPSPARWAARGTSPLGPSGRTPGARGRPQSGHVQTPWTREQIRAARMAPLVPLLQQRGLLLQELPAGNFALATHPGLLIKDSYWRWPERDLAGNAIDFWVKVLGLSFSDAMREITGS